MLLQSFRQRLRLELWDHHKSRSNRLIGRAFFDLHTLEEHPSQVAAHSKLLKRGTARADILLSVSFLATLNPTPQPWSQGPGIVSLALDGAKHLDSGPTHMPQPLAQVFLDYAGDAIHQTKSGGSTTDPVWTSKYDFLSRDRTSCIIIVKVLCVCTSCCNSDDGLLGSITIPLDDLLAADPSTSWPMTGSTSGQLIMSASWKQIMQE